jgi:hypothetical protein
MENLGDEERHDPGSALVQWAARPIFRGPTGLLGLAPDVDAPRTPRREQLVGVDFVGPAEEVLLRLVGGRPIDSTAVGAVPFGLNLLAALECVTPSLSGFCDRTLFVTARHH